MVQVTEIPGRDTAEPTVWRIGYLGRDLTADLSPYVLGVTWTDYLSGQSDEISIELEDADDRWLGDWYPVKGDTLTLSMTYPGQAPLNCGSFEVDEINADGPPSVVVIRGLSAGVSKGVRTRKGYAYENTTLAEVAAQVAKRNKLTLVGEIRPLRIDRITQFRERDLAFITRVGRQYGYAVKLRENKLIFTAMAGLRDGAPVRTISRKECSRYGLKDKIKDVYRSAKNTHHDPDSQKTIRSEAQDTRAPDSQVGMETSADELRINQRAPDAASAQAQAEAALGEANDERAGGSLTLPADRRLVAGAVVTLDPSWGRMAGDYLINQARHSKRRSSGTTADIEIRRVTPAPVPAIPALAGEPAQSSTEATA
jgi:phage protein D